MPFSFRSWLFPRAARFAGARGFVDAIIPPEETRDTLAFLLEVTSQFPGPHLGAFVLPPVLGDP